MNNIRIQMQKEGLKRLKKNYEKSLKELRNSLLTAYLESAKSTIGNLIVENKDCSIEIFKDEMCQSFFYDLNNEILNSCKESIEKTRNFANMEFNSYKGILYNTFIKQIDEVIWEIEKLLRTGILISENFCTDKFPVPDDLYYEVIPEEKLQKYKTELIELRECSIDELVEKKSPLHTDFMTKNYKFLNEVFDEIRLLLLA